jgi:hypothetical protein
MARFFIFMVRLYIRLRLLFPYNKNTIIKFNKYSIFFPLAIEHNILTFVGSIITPESKTNALTKSVPVNINKSPTPVKN